MTHKSTFTPALLFTGIIVSNSISLNEIYPILESHFNNTIGQISKTFPFSHSNYYESEMGPDLQRVFLSFKTPICPSTGYRYKLLAHDIESRYCDGASRRINIDPGILSLHNLILFSTKNYAHRIACQDGIFAELTCKFSSKTMIPLEWTYPDFKLPAIEDFFLSIRQDYHHHLKENYDSVYS
ncbi:hypothetical protein DID78_02490 [Candidatus Marinamargulisbacteria bacterium SCGC AG-343-D04]|nr:hypothetical protein DID78_02490 [Candidatus Marinamargulisbacteria bacterium SCGC AG-343-D04]